MKQTFERDISFKRLSEDDNFYRYIFKKTEKIVSVVFYVLSHTPDTRSHSLIDDVAASSKEVHRFALDSLTHFQHAADEVLTSYVHALIGLDSTIRIAAAGGVIPNDVMQLVTNEIEVVLRGINNRYLKRELPMTLGDQVDTSSRPRRSAVAPSSVGERQSTSSDVLAAPRPSTAQPSASASGQTAAPVGQDRRGRIQTILEARGESSIKDIADIISDVSEKTIQRELNAMIEDNVIRRIGERRWSKYVLN